MEMKNYIEKAEKKAGMQIELAKILNISSSNIRAIKAGKRGMPVDICIILADYIEEDRLEVIAASNLVTEKDERKRKILESCFQRTSKAASFIIAALFVAVTSITSPNPANASQASSHTSHICIMLNQTSQLRRKSDRIADVTAVTADNYFETSGQIN